jgi:hypothetical protein
MDTLKETLKKTVWEYAGGGNNLQTFPVLNEEAQVYSVLVINTPVRTLSAGIVVMARIVDQHIIIEEDITDRPLYEALMARGIPRERIILAYVGESLPEAQGV